MALCADFRIAGADARLGQPEILLGLIPGAGGTQRLARLIGPSRAKDLIFTGRQVGADEALSIGLVDRVVPAAEVYEQARAWAAKLAKGPALALRAAKESVDAGLETDLETGLAVERGWFAGLFATEDRERGMRSASWRTGRARPIPLTCIQGAFPGPYDGMGQASRRGSRGFRWTRRVAASTRCMA